MSTESYQTTQRGIKVFPEGNRLDFVLEAPGEAKQRASVFFNKKDQPVTLAGESLVIPDAERNEEGKLVNPYRMTIHWGDRILNLGWCAKEGKKPYFYRGLESQNDRNRPKTPEEIFEALGM